MNKWVKKSFVALVTVLTFGLVTPFQPIHATNEPLDEHDNNDVLEADTANQKQTFEYTYAEEEPVISSREKFLKEAIQIGEVQSIKKFGKKIAPVIEDEFQQIILPNIENAIAKVTEQFTDEDLEYLAISEVPGKGQSEKIFHIYNVKTNQDVIRFHVRRDLRPLEGYWFNFHYHTYHDDFQTHYVLGEIYWDKNTPPNWANA